MSHLQPIYDVWDGNAEAMAADIDELGVTVRQWRNRNDIPSRAWPKIIKAAAEKGKVIRLADFLSPEVKSQLPPHAVGHNPMPESPSATNGRENIRCADLPRGETQGDAEEGVPHGPFSVTSSVTNAQLSPKRSAASPACSDGTSEVAA